MAFKERTKEELESIKNSSIEDRKQELKFYFILRQDFKFSDEDLTKMVYKSLLELSKNILSNPNKEDVNYKRFVEYTESQQTQAKICLRIKHELSFNNVLEILRDNNISSYTYKDDRRPLMTVFGPISNNGLPKYIKEMQTYQDKEDLPLYEMTSKNNDETKEKVIMYIRNDIVFPIGKKVAQIGHGVFGFVNMDKSIENLESLLELEIITENVSLKQLSEIREKIDNNKLLETTYIVDAGRTVFNEPTPTVMGLKSSPISSQKLCRQIF
jgi:peptidyl-tRNA hydrolase